MYSMQTAPSPGNGGAPARTIIVPSLSRHMLHRNGDGWKSRQDAKSESMAESLGHFTFVFVVCYAISFGGEACDRGFHSQFISGRDAISKHGIKDSRRNRTMPRRPPRFRSFVGQRRWVTYLHRQLEGALSRGEPFPHTLFVGPSGVGKTLLAGELAREYGTNFTVAMGYTPPDDLARKFTQQKKGDFVLIDECHNLKPTAQELLYQVIDDHRIPCQTSSEDEQETKDDERMEIAPSTIILATDQPGLLLNALRKRISVRVTLDRYSIAEMKEIVEQLATNLSLLLSPQAAKQIAGICGGIPRRAKHHLENLRRFHSDAESRQIGQTQLREFLRASRIDSLGLGPEHREFLAILDDDDFASLESLSLRIGIDKRYLQAEVEEPLVRLGFVTIGPKGRTLTEKGQDHVQRHCKRKVDEEIKGG